MKQESDLVQAAAAAFGERIVLEQFAAAVAADAGGVGARLLPLAQAPLPTPHCPPPAAPASCSLPASAVRSPPPLFAGLAPPQDWLMLSQPLLAAC